MKKRTLAAIGAGVLAIGAALVFIPQAQAATTGYVALTFDDGPSGDNSRKLLNYLAQKNARATFFLRGDQVAADPGLALQEYQAGHQIGNHSWDHPALSGLSDDDVRSQFSRTNDAIVAAGIPKPVLWRPPFGEVTDKLRALGNEFGMSQVVFDNVPADYEGGSKAEAQYICDFVVSHAKDQSIVLQHDFVLGTVDAVPCIVDGLRAKGLEPGRLIPSDTQSPLSSSWAKVVPWGDAPATTATTAPATTPATTAPPTSAPSDSSATLTPSLDRDDYYATTASDAWINTSIYQTAYFKFNLATVSTVNSAKLRLYRANTESGQVTVKANQVSDDNWGAGGALPSIGAVAGQATAPASEGWIEIDVSDYLKSRRAAGTTATIAVTSSSATWTSFLSADSATNKPQLVIS